LHSGGSQASQYGPVQRERPPTFLQVADRAHLTSSRPLDVAAAVFYSDSDISRGGATRSDMGTDWHRQLRLTIPVRRPQLWSQTDVLSALTSAVSFLTGDDFEFVFTKAEDTAGVAGFLNLDPSEGVFKADQVIMFSGGLDSFAGALETLATTSGKVILVSHQSAPKVATRQRELAHYLTTRFPGRIRHIRFRHIELAKSRMTLPKDRGRCFSWLWAAPSPAPLARRTCHSSKMAS
jgi:hypothetical protein